jgi:hypothetical protein
MDDSSRRSGHVWYWVAAISFLLLVAYPLSYGPWCWYVRHHHPEVIHLWLYGPLRWFMKNGPDWLVVPYLSYVYWWFG